MKRQFTIPVMCAVLFHAALLLGSRREPNTVQLSNEPPAGSATPLVHPPFELPVLELTSDDNHVLQNQGDTDESAPASPEPFIKPDSDVFSQEQVPLPKAGKIAVDKIPAGIVGVPHGSPDGMILTAGVFDVTKLDNPPRTTAQVAPVYPAEARMRGQGGEVVVGFIVTESGRVASAYVMRTTDALFNDAAVRAVEKWRFEPGRHLGRAVRFKMTVPIIFRMN
jgi:TonB family protein